MSHPISADDFRRHAAAIEDQVGQVIVGQRALVRQTLITLLAGGNALLEGVPGLGKTVLVRTLAQAVDCAFSRIQFTPDLMPSDIVGTNLIVDDEHGRRFQFEQGPIFANLVLADEINRATPKTQSAMLEAMQERSVTVAKATRPLPQPFFVLATQNPLEMEGTYPLPEAQLDRFFFKIDVAFPTADELVEIALRTTGADQPTAHAVVDGPTLLAMQALAWRCLSPIMVNFAARLLKATHPNSAEAPEMVRRYVLWGQPRGMQAMILAAKIGFAGRSLQRRLRRSARRRPALRHRLILNFEAQAEGVSADGVIRGYWRGWGNGCSGTPPRPSRDRRGHDFAEFVVAERELLTCGDREWALDTLIATNIADPSTVLPRLRGVREVFNVVAGAGIVSVCELVFATAIRPSLA
ncbi:MAG: AAA family ATPase [Caldilineaceae bacterium]